MSEGALYNATIESSLNTFTISWLWYTSINLFLQSWRVPWKPFVELIYQNTYAIAYVDLQAQNNTDNEHYLQNVEPQTPKAIANTAQQMLEDHDIFWSSHFTETRSRNGTANVSRFSDSECEVLRHYLSNRVWKDPTGKQRAIALRCRSV